MDDDTTDIKMSLATIKTMIQTLQKNQNASEQKLENLQEKSADAHTNLMLLTEHVKHEEKVFGEILPAVELKINKMEQYAQEALVVNTEQRVFIDKLKENQEKIERRINKLETRVNLNEKSVVKLTAYASVIATVLSTLAQLFVG